MLFNLRPEFAVTFPLQESGKGTLGKSVSLLKLSVLSSVQSLVPNKGPSWCRMLARDCYTLCSLSVFPMELHSEVSNRGQRSFLFSVLSFVFTLLHW